MLAYVASNIGANLLWFSHILPVYSKYRRYYIDGNKLLPGNIVRRCENDIHLLYELLINPANVYKLRKIMEDVSHL